MRVKAGTCPRCRGPLYAGHGCEACSRDRAWERKHPPFKIVYGSVIQPPALDPDHTPKTTLDRGTFTEADRKREYQRLYWVNVAKARRSKYNQRYRDKKNVDREYIRPLEVRQRISEGMRKTWAERNGGK